jgi:hypothetical protein
VTGAQSLGDRVTDLARDGRGKGLAGEHLHEEHDGFVGVVRAPLTDTDCAGEVREAGRVENVVDFCGAKADAGGVKDAVAAVSASAGSNREVWQS